MLKEKLAANAPQDKVKEGEQKADETNANFKAQFFEALAKKQAQEKVLMDAEDNHKRVQSQKLRDKGWVSLKSIELWLNGSLNKEACRKLSEIKEALGIQCH
jgi:hypothetical protein